MTAGRKSFNGTLEQLQHVIFLTGQAGNWEYMPARFWRFRSSTRAILNWWPSTGTVNFQGPSAAKAAFEQALINVLGGRGQQTGRLTDGRGWSCPD